jgi:hypothetical protein
MAAADRPEAEPRGPPNQGFFAKKNLDRDPNIWNISLVWIAINSRDPNQGVFYNYFDKMSHIAKFSRDGHIAKLWAAGVMGAARQLERLSWHRGPPLAQG